MANDEPQQLHVVFFPFMAYGHMNPTIDIAKLFAARGVKATIITTPHNLSIFTKAIEKSRQVGSPMIHVELFEFPSTQCGLPDGCENVTQAIPIGMVSNFMKAVKMLEVQLEQYLENIRPNCLVSDMFLPWTTECAAKFDVPRVVFHGTCYFALCVQEVVRLHKPYLNVSSDEEPFILPSLPHEIKITKLQIQEDLRKEEQSDAKTEFDLIKESELKSFGVIVNSFYELEPDYADYFSKELGRRAWHIGPASLCHRSIEDKARRGNQVSADEHECLQWLNSKQEDSVIYMCFGSMTQFSVTQLREIAVALEASEQDFLWFVKNDEDLKSEEWLPPGYKQRMEGKGLILKGWAPQLLILEHEAVGAFVTHCGWNSILEGITAGVPMITWPGFAEQFYNEKLVTKVLKTGVPIGAKKCRWDPYIDDLVNWDAIEKALRDIMEGDEARQRRNRAKELKELALKAVEEDGSSYSNLGAFINELRHYHA
ncbi:scopoletin glucosyltransferase-like [Chenopodium quinoa]|uniref:scopoletin glucosyltransferase-like n=1 Tax=Chenopodium quinoa TaxID=63459 RepID=UPI000B77E1E6|nr:scopoletin glucosyltransferase-like [Chenopodium quinoa]